MKKILLIISLVTCFNMLQAKDSEVVGKYISHMKGGEGTLVFLTFQINGKEEIFGCGGCDKEILEKHKNKPMLIKFEDFGGGNYAVKNIYFADGTNVKNEKKEEVKISSQNLKTYTNARFGFSLQYPSDLLTEKTYPENGSDCNTCRQTAARPSMPFLKSTGAMASRIRICGVTWIMAGSKKAVRVSSGPGCPRPALSSRRRFDAASRRCTCKGTQTRQSQLR